MPTEDGILAAIAFQAVKQCHGDAAKLLRDLDSVKKKEGAVRLWEGRDAVTLDVSKSINAEHWMPERIYRLYKRADGGAKIEGLNIWYFGSHPCVVEPLLVVGLLEYVVGTEQEIKDVASAWDLISAFCEWCKATTGDFDKPLHCSFEGRVSRGAVIGTNLYGIHGVDAVLDMLEKCRCCCSTTAT